MNEWISAAIAVGAGLLLGSIASRVVRTQLMKSELDALRESAAPISGLVFSGCVIAGLLVALGFVSPDDLDKLPTDLINFLPKAITAAILIIGGNIAGTFAGGAVGRALAGSGAAAKFAPGIVRTATLVTSVILAATSIGINTTVINIAVAALLFGIAASAAMLIGLGGRRIAGEVAAGRVWRRSLRDGDYIRAENVAGVEVDGVVVEIHPTTIEVEAGASTLFVPNTLLMDSVVQRTRQPDPQSTTASGELAE